MYVQAAITQPTNGPRKGATNTRCPVKNLSFSLSSLSLLSLYATAGVGCGLADEVLIKKD